MPFAGDVAVDFGERKNEAILRWLPGLFGCLLVLPDQRSFLHLAELGDFALSLHGLEGVEIAVEHAMDALLVHADGVEGAGMVA